MSSRCVDESPKIAVVIPCYNEELTIAKVVQDFERSLPRAVIYVFDNNCTDDTAAKAQEAGARVIREKRQGKGFVIASMLAKVDADYYIVVDGDDTYPAEKAMDLLSPLIRDEADVVVGQRLSDFASDSFRPLHVLGNKLVANIINLIFSANLVDVMSGYRAFTREVAENLPIVASGFDVETEMTLQLLYRNFVIKEVPVSYRARPLGSSSKLRTFQDGIRILFRILGILKAYKPMTFFGILALFTFLLGLLGGSVVVYEYILYEYVYRVPTAILAVGCMLLSVILASIGVTLHTLNFRILEMTNLLTKQISRIQR